MARAGQELLDIDLGIVERAARLLARQVRRLAVIAGAAYGLCTYFRLSTATSIDVLDEGVARIAGAVAALKKPKA